MILALALSLGSFIAPRVVPMSLQREVEIAIYGGAIALFLQLVAVGISIYAKARRVMWAAIGGGLLTAVLTFVALRAQV